MEFWPHWLRPEWLLLTPLLGGLLWQLWHRERRAGRWQQILPSVFHSLLLTRSTGRGNRLPWIALGLAWLLALLALLGPSWQQQEQLVGKPADPLVIMVELTPQMLASDAPPNRLEQARRKILDLLDARRDAQTAVVVYAGSAHVLVPLSDDMATIHNLLDALKPSIMPEPGQRADLAVAKALDLLRQGARDQGRLLLMTGALSETERSAIARQLGRQGERLLVLGMGTSQGAPILQETGGYLLDDQGAIKLSRLDSASLNRFADEMGARYTPWRLDDGDLRMLDLLPQLMHEEDGESVRLAHWVDQGHWLLLPLLLLAACAGRRGWLFCLPLLLGVPQSGHAWSFDDLWLRADQQGQRLLEAQRPAEAAQRFTDPLRQGHALYQAGDYPAAALRFAQGDSAADHYNRGNALARAGELEAALEAYDQALALQPELPQALHNRTLVEDLLRQRQEEEQQHEEESPSPSGSPQPSPAGIGGQQGEERAADTPPEDEPLETGEAPANPTSASRSDSDHPAQAAAQSFDTPNDERRQALEQWLRQIPDDPAELLRRKFRYEQQTRDPMQ